MATGKDVTSFHVRHDFTPHLARETLLLLLAAPAISKDDILDRARAHDLELGHRQSADKLLASLRDLGFVERADNRAQYAAQLTPLGMRVATISQKDPLLFAELIHLRYFFLWPLQGHTDYFSWAYRIVCNALWNTAPTPLDSGRLVTTVLIAAEEEFTMTTASFSTASVLGVTNWLRQLSPPCIDGGLFRRRPISSPEAFTLALKAHQRATSQTRDAPLEIDSQTREQVCRALLLDEASFEEMLEQATEAMGLIRRRTTQSDLVLLRDSFLPELVY